MSPAQLIQAVGITSENVEEVLRRLDSELNTRDDYLDARRHRIDSLKNILRADSTSTHQHVMTSESLARHYTSYNNDSALYYFSEALNEAKNLHLDSIVTTLSLRYSTYLPLAGLYDLSDRIFNGIDTTGMSREMKALYYDSGRQMYSYTAAYFREQPELHQQVIDKMAHLQLSLLGVLPPSSALYQFNQGEYFYVRQEYSRAKAVLLDLLGKLNDTDNLYARTANILASVAKARGDTNEYLYYLALSAIADLKSGTLEVASLQELGTRMFELDEIDRAHNYLAIAHRNAVECRAIPRIIESSTSMPLIENAHTIELNRSRHMLVGILMVMALLVAGLITALVFLRRDMKRLRDYQTRLRNANNIKEVYITQFLSLCSIYMDKLNQFCKVAHRKISTGKVDDLYKLTKSGKFVEEQSREFYEVFDEAFLHLYPTFHAEVNKLLRPDGRIELKESEKLNTDLRILAFMRLGIEESTRIAQVLNYSVYTIYTYRNKLKNRAINRETFECDVMKIGSIV